MNPELDWRGDVDTIHTLTEPIVPTLSTPRPVDVRLEKGTGDYLDELDRLGKQLVVAGGEYRPLLDLDGLDGGSLLGPFERKLQEAKESVAHQEYRGALDLLDEALALPDDDAGSIRLAGSAAEPDGIAAARVEALHLKGFCHAELEEPENAIMALRPLRDDALEGRVGELRRKVRTSLLGRIAAENMDLVRTGRFDDAVRRLQVVIDLDPEVAAYHFMLAGTCMMADRLDEAGAAVARGLEYARGTERERLIELGERVERRAVEQKLAPARKHYRKGNYPRARSAIDKLQPRFREASLCRTFRDYLDDLGGGLMGIRRGRSPAAVRPRGSFPDVDAMHFFLVGQEIVQSKLAMMLTAYGPASNVLDRALELAPHFPYAHFLKGACLYNMIFASLASREKPPLDATIAMLEAALEHARHGQQDAEISTATELAGAVEGLLGMMTAVRREMQARAEEVSRVNRLIETFHSIRGDVEGGIRSPEHYREIRGRLEELDRETTAVRSTVSRQPASDTVVRLAEVVSDNLDQLRRLEPQIEEGEKLKALMEEYAAIMQKAEDEPTRKKQAELRKSLGRLRDRVGKFRARVRDPDVGNAAEQLAGAIERNLGVLDDGEKLRPLAEKFQSIMAGASDGIGTMRQAKGIESELVMLQGTLEKLQFELTSEPGNKQREQLHAAVSGNLVQVRALMKSMAALEPVRAAWDRFNTLMGTVQGGIRSHRQLNSFREELMHLFSEVVDLQRHQSDEEVRSATTKLLEAIANVSSQLDRL